MGLAVLPARLKEELELLEEYILEGRDIASTKRLRNMLPGQRIPFQSTRISTKDNIHEILQKEVGIVFTCSGKMQVYTNAHRKAEVHLCDSLKHYNNKCS